MSLLILVKETTHGLFIRDFRHAYAVYKTRFDNHISIHEEEIPSGNAIVPLETINLKTLIFSLVCC